MKIKDYCGILSLLFLLITGLSACKDDSPKDVVNEIKMSVLPQPGIMYGPFDSKMEHPIECMVVMSEDYPGDYSLMEMNRIEGFTYVKGHEYFLSVKRTILANPPADGYNRTYSLLSILQDRIVTEPANL